MQAHFETRMQVEDTSIRYHSLARAQSAGYGEYSRLPYCLKIVLENLLRFYDEDVVGEQDLKALGRWLDKGGVEHEIAFHPARVLMQDFTGVPAIADLGAMRDAMAALGKDPGRVNPLIPVDLVIDHSVMVDQFATKDAFAINVEREFARNGERYAFLRWGQQAFDNFRVVPPGTGICHQVNLEYLSQLVCLDSGDPALAFPDTVLGTDSHTTMVNALGVLGWGVGGIEAEAAMLGQPVSMLIPAVVGMRFEGKLRPGVLATDLVLRVVERLREAGVVSKFVEFFGPGLDHLTLADRATIANMAPEYGATCGIFSIDQETMRYLHLTGRSPHQIACVEAYGRAQGLVRSADMDDAIYSEIITLDLEAIKPAIAGPKRPQDRVELEDAPDSFQKTCQDFGARAAQPIAGSDAVLEDGAVVIAAITSCTNTSNPTVMIAAGLLAQKACERGLSVKPWTKTSLAPGSQVVMDYLEQAGLDQALDQLGFHLVGYGCMTCIGNSGPLPPAIAAAVHAGDLTVCSVLSGNRNFEGRINPGVKANYLASPPLVVAYALAGTMKINLTSEPLGLD
ncbi:MAG: aconitate hydratase AcnA, partial [Pseudomonadota bacterium]